MTTDYRALCAELAGWIERSTRHYIREPEVLIRARAALAEPEPEAVGPTVMEIIELADEIEAADLGQVDFARAVLARYSHQPAPPAEGEVAELVEWLRDDLELYPAEKRRAADLLEHRHPAPVPVSERLPGVGDCDAEGRCWVHQPHEACPESPAWELMLAKYASPNYGATCWLPATALPLPSGEVE